MIDNGVNIAIERSTIKFNPALMGSNIKSTQKLYLGYVFIKYKSSDDFTLTLNYRRGDVNSEIEQLSYTISANNNYFKQKLPPNITVTEFWLTISGSIAESFECDSMGILWDIYNAGME